MVPFMFEVENDTYTLYHIWITLKDLWEEFLIYGTNHLHIHQITVKIFTSPYIFSTPSKATVQKATRHRHHRRVCSASAKYILGTYTPCHFLQVFLLADFFLFSKNKTLHNIKTTQTLGSAAHAEPLVSLVWCGRCAHQAGSRWYSAHSLRPQLATKMVTS